MNTWPQPIMKTWFSLSPVGEFQGVVAKAAIGKKKKKKRNEIYF